MSHLFNTEILSDFSLGVVNGGYLCFIVTATTFSVLLAIQQLCITEIQKHNYKLLGDRIATFLWCITSWALNGLQLYSYHDQSHYIIISLRILTGIYIFIGLVATYRFVKTNIDSMYEIKNIYIKPTLFYKIWYFMFCANVMCLSMLYLVAFMTSNAIWFDMYYIFIDITFWFGSIVTFWGVCKINNFLTNTLEGVIDNKYNNDIQIQYKRMKKLKQMKLKIHLIIFVSVFLLIPVTWSLCMNGYVLIEYFDGHNTPEQTSIYSQPYQKFPQYVGFSIFLIAIDLEMLVWTYSNSKWCTKVSKYSFYMMYCLCNDPKSGRNNCCTNNKRKKEKSASDVSLNSDTTISSYHLQYNVTEYEYNSA